MPPMTILKDGYGAGDKILSSIPNLLRVILIMLGKILPIKQDQFIIVVKKNKRVFMELLRKKI